MADFSTDGEWRDDSDTPEEAVERTRTGGKEREHDGDGIEAGGAAGAVAGALAGAAGGPAGSLLGASVGGFGGALIGLLNEDEDAEDADPGT